MSSQRNSRAVVRNVEKKEEEDFSLFVIPPPLETEIKLEVVPQPLSLELLKIQNDQQEADKKRLETLKKVKIDIDSSPSLPNIATLGSVPIAIKPSRQRVITTLEKVFMNTKYSAPFHCCLAIAQPLKKDSQVFPTSSESLYMSTFDWDSQMLYASGQVETEVLMDSFNPLSAKRKEVHQLPPCANGNQCVGIDGSIKRASCTEPDGSVFKGRILRSFIRHDEMNLLFETTGRTCLLCHRKRVSDLSLPFQAHLFPQVSPPVILQQVFNLIRPGEYSLGACIVPSDTYSGLVAPLAGFDTTLLEWVYEDGVYRVDQSRMRYGTVDPLLSHRMGMKISTNDNFNGFPVTNELGKK